MPRDRLAAALEFHPTQLPASETSDTLLDEVLSLAPDQRATRIREEPARYAVPLLAERLLEKIGNLLPEHLVAAQELASLACLILRHASSSSRVISLYALAVAQQANAMRAQGELLKAASLMDAARFLLRMESEEEIEPLLLAKLDSLEGSLRKSQRRGEEAIRLLERSAKVFIEHGDFLEGAKGLMSLGAAHSVFHSHEEALAAYRRADEMLEVQDAPPRERLMARQSITILLFRLGQIRDARASFESLQDLYEVVPEAWAQDRRVWTEGNLAFAERRFNIAEERYRQAIQRFRSRDLHYSAALVGKDLAVLYAHEGRLKDLETTIDELIPVFEEREVQYEVDAARKILRDALGSRREVN